MKKIILILLMIILSGCHQSNQSVEVLSETLHYYDVIEGQIGQKKYSEHKEYKNGQVVKSYKISSDNDIYHEEEYNYKGDLLLSINSQNDSQKQEILKEYNDNRLIASYSYKDGVLIGKTLFEYDGDTKTISFYDEKDIFQKTIETKDERNVYSETIFYPEGVSAIFEYVLDDNDLLIKLVETTEYKITTSEIVYDDYGNKLTSFTSTEKIKEIENQGNLSEIYSDTLIEYEYVYDEQGQYTEMKIFMNDELIQYVIREIIYED